MKFIFVYRRSFIILDYRVFQNGPFMNHKMKNIHYKRQKIVAILKKFVNHIKMQIHRVCKIGSLIFKKIKIFVVLNCRPLGKFLIG